MRPARSAAGWAAEKRKAAELVAVWSLAKYWRQPASEVADLTVAEFAWLQTAAQTQTRREQQAARRRSR